MPGGVSGRELGQRVRARQPAQRVLYMSGYPRDDASAAPEKLRLHSGARMLAKPFTPAALLLSVRECLDAEPNPAEHGAKGARD